MRQRYSEISWLKYSQVTKVELDLFPSDFGARDFEETHGTSPRQVGRRTFHLRPQLCGWVLCTTPCASQHFVHGQQRAQYDSGRSVLFLVFFRGPEAVRKLSTWHSWCQKKEGAGANWLKCGWEFKLPTSTCICQLDWTCSQFCNQF